MVFSENNNVKILYIAPSYIPSINANGVHVVNQCSAINDEGTSVTLITCRKIFSHKKHYSYLIKKYGEDVVKKIDSIKSFYYPFNTATTLFIGIYSFFYFLIYNNNNYILSRNLYASFFLLFLRSKNLVYETHQLEIGIRKKIQKILLNSKKTKLVLISKELKKHLENYHNCKIIKAIILHDAAPKNIKILSNSEKNMILTNRKIPYLDYETINGYFGQLYEGRGIENIIKIAQKLPNDLFLIYGGSFDDVKKRKEKNNLYNVKYMGAVDHPEALLMMQTIDILLMPYQENVSIGQKGHDTSAWMSPMKMFEYMSSNSAIISSDHKVLKEVLSHEKNALIFDKNNYLDWVEGIKRLKKNIDLMDKIKKQSYEDYENLYTWNIRGKKIIKFMKIN